MKLSDYIVEFLTQQGTKEVFLVTGGAIANVVDSVGRRHDDQGDIRYVVVQHEQAAAMAAEVYSRIGPGLGVAMATSGPGATNLITGICGLWFDSIPGLFITGQVGTPESVQKISVTPRQVGFQETDIVSIAKPITKYAVRVTDPGQIRYELEKAVYLAKSGRPGPVLVDVPVDVQVAQIDPATLPTFTPDASLDENETRDQGNALAEKVTQMYDLLKNAQRPVLLLGGGIKIARALDQARALAEKLQIPVSVSWSGFDILPHDHPLYVGHHGVYGSRGANFLVQNADLLISVGSRLDTRQTGGQVKLFAREAKKVMVDIDKHELGKRRGLTPDLSIHADAKDFLEAALKSAPPEPTKDLQEWRERAAQWKIAYPAVLPQYRAQSALSAYVAAEEICKQSQEEQTVIIDEGGNLVWSMQTWTAKPGQQIISTFGNSPMGYALPAAIGAAISRPGQNIICIDGDGGFQLNIQELQTVAHYQLPIKFFILNNRSMGIIKQFQNLAFDSRRYAVDPGSDYSAPDFGAVAGAYGIKTVRINSLAELTEGITSAMSTSGPVLCDIWIDEHQELNPKLEYGKPLEDMYPYLSDKELSDNMIIQQLPRVERGKGWVTLKEESE